MFCTMLLANRITKEYTIFTFHHINFQIRLQCKALDESE